MTDNWDMEFISREDFLAHAKATVKAYRAAMEPYDLAKFNQNTIDPIKLTLDKCMYGIDWRQVVDNEVFRQRDKGCNNTIGYFHQNIFKFIKGCDVPRRGWDVIYRNEDGIDIGDGTTVQTVYVEMKNKHNTMNAASSERTYKKAQAQLLEDDRSACFLVEVIAKASQNIPWQISMSGEKVSHRLIRRVSIDKFLEIVTGDPRAFYKICMAFPEALSSIVDGLGGNVLPRNTVYDEVERLARETGGDMGKAFYLLGFSGYQGFDDDYEAADI